MPLIAFGLSVAGARRKHSGYPNEDAMVVCPERGLFAAIDGVSTRPFARQAAEAIAEHVLKLNGSPNFVHLHLALMDATQAMNQMTLNAKLERFPACVATVLWIEETEEAVVGCAVHAGDTGLYVIDHGARSIRLMTPMEVHSTFPYAIYNFIGPGAPQDPFTAKLRFKQLKGGTLLLASDGLTKRTSQSQIAETVIRSSTPQEAVEELVELAQDAGSTDDITVVAIRIA